MCKNFIKLFVLSCIFVLLLGLSCQSLAGYRYYLTSEDCYTLCDHYFGSNTTKRDKYYAKLMSFINTYESSYDNMALAFQTYSSGSINIYFFNNSQITSIGNPGNVNYMQLQFNGDVRHISIGYNPGDRWTNPYATSSNNLRQTQVTLGSGAQLRTVYLFVANDINNLFTGPWESSQIIGPFPVPYTWTFDNRFSAMYLSGDNNAYNGPVGPVHIGVNVSDLGTLVDSSLCSKIEMLYLFYDKTRNTWLEAYRRIPFDIDNDVITDIYPYDINSQNEITSYVNTKSNLITENMMIFLRCYPQDEDLEVIEGYYYVVGSHTVINSGDNSISIPDTFNDSYYDDYISNVDDILNNPTNDIINMIGNIEDILTNNGTEIPDIIASFFSGDSGDLYHKLGYVDYDNPFQDNIYTVLMGCKDVLIGTGHVVLDLNHHGSTNLYIDSDDIYVPYGALKVFISAAFVFLFIWGYLKMFFYWVRLITTFDLFGLKQLVRDSAWIAKFF